LNDLSAVQKSVQEFHKMNLKIDILINNAGVMTVFSVNKTTKQGYQQMMGVNYLGHYLLNRVSI
jgi:NADP-dependent 3-hydroxy acid dehydrogenase YdfG